MIEQCQHSIDNRWVNSLRKIITIGTTLVLLTGLISGCSSARMKALENVFSPAPVEDVTVTPEIPKTLSLSDILRTHNATCNQQQDQEAAAMVNAAVQQFITNFCNYPDAPLNDLELGLSQLTKNKLLGEHYQLYFGLLEDQLKKYRLLETTNNNAQNELRRKINLLTEIETQTTLNN